METLILSLIGANPNVQRKDDLWSPLFVAAMLGRTQVANLLLQVQRIFFSSLTDGFCIMDILKGKYIYFLTIGQ
jgi:hypothetical protein